MKKQIVIVPCMNGLVALIPGDHLGIPTLDYHAFYQGEPYDDATWHVLRRDFPGRDFITFTAWIEQQKERG